MPLKLSARAILVGSARASAADKPSRRAMALMLIAAARYRRYGLFTIPNAVP
jgi:hypothetical protein